MADIVRTEVVKLRSLLDQRDPNWPSRTRFSLSQLVAKTGLTEAEVKDWASLHEAAIPRVTPVPEGYRTHQRVARAAGAEMIEDHVDGICQVSAADIAKRVSVSIPTVYSWAKARGVRFSSRKVVNEEPVADRETAQKLFRETFQGVCIHTCAESVAKLSPSASKSHVRYWASAAGVKLRPGMRGADPHRDMRQARRMASLAFKTGEPISPSRLARDLGVAPATVERWAKRAGAPLVTRRHSRIDRERVDALVRVPGATIEGVAQEAGVSPAYVRARAAHHGVQFSKGAKGKRGFARVMFKARDEDGVFCRYTARQIAQEVKVAPATVGRWAKEDGVRLTPAPPTARTGELPATRQRRILEGRLSRLLAERDPDQPGQPGQSARCAHHVRAIAEALNVTESRVNRQARQEGVKLSPTYVPLDKEDMDPLRRRTPAHVLAALTAILREGLHTTPQIARMVGVSEQTVRSRAKGLRLQIPRRQPSGAADHPQNAERLARVSAALEAMLDVETATI